MRPTETGRLPSHIRFDWAPSSPADTGPTPLVSVPLRRESDDAIVYAAPDTPPEGLRKFDLGIVPASVTPPRSWRRAAWFAVGTAAAVVCGLAVAAGRLVGAPPSSDTIDALPAFPTQQLGPLPVDEPTHARASTTSRPPSSSSTSPSARPSGTRRPGDPVPPGAAAPPGTPGTASGTAAGPTTWSEAPPPPRTTVGPQPVTPTNPDAMGDRTEEYFAFVTEDPQAASDMCTAGMAREGPAGIESRYEGVDHVEVQDITIDRNQATTTSTVKLVHEDGTETVEQRRLSFTWGGDPKISRDTSAG